MDGSTPQINRWIALLSLLCLLVPTTFSSAADEAASFTAVCTAQNVHGYRSSYALDGSRMEPEWSEGEKFFKPDWSFSYSGGDKISIAGIERPVVAFSPELLFASEYAEALAGASLWSYVINLKMKEIIAAEVQGGELVALSIKGRLVSFDCKFSFH